MGTETEGDVFAAKETEPGFKKHGFRAPPGAVKRGLWESGIYIAVLLAVCAIFVGPIDSCNKRGFVEDCVKLHQQAECDLRWKAGHPYD